MTCPFKDYRSKVLKKNNNITHELELLQGAQRFEERNSPSPGAKDSDLQSTENIPCPTINDAHGILFFFNLQYMLKCISKSVN